MNVVVILDDEDLEALKNGEMVKIEVRNGEIVGLVTNKWVEKEDAE